MRCNVPRVIGKTLSGARALLDGANCRAGAIKRAYSLKAKGKIVGQHPSAGTNLRANAKVDLVVSKGRKPRRRPH